MDADKRKVWILMISDRSGYRRYWISPRKDEVLNSLTNYVRERWNNHCGGEFPSKNRSVEKKAIDLYFNIEGIEYYDLKQKTIYF